PDRADAQRDSDVDTTASQSISSAGTRIAPEKKSSANATGAGATSAGPKPIVRAVSPKSRGSDAPEATDGDVANGTGTEDETTEAAIDDAASAANSTTAALDAT